MREGERLRFVNLEENKGNAEFWFFEPGALIVLDELWRVWPSGLKANEIPVFQLAFIKEHRHRTDEAGRWQDIILVSQMLADVATSVREMVETTVVCSQFHDMGMANRFLREYYTGPVKQLQGKSAALVNNERCEYKAEVYQYYRSNTQGKSDVGPQGEKVVQQTFWKSWKFRAGVTVLGSSLVLIVYGAVRTSSEIDKVKERSKAAPVPSPADSHPVPPPKPAPALATSSKPVEPPESERWRLSGKISVDGVVRYYLITDGRSSRRVRPTMCVTNIETVCTYQGELIARYTGAERGGDLTKLPSNGLNTAAASLPFVPPAPPPAK
jgi:zona occludens toxin